MIGYLSKIIINYSNLAAPLREITHHETKFRWGEKEKAAFEQLKGTITEDRPMAYFNPQPPIIVRTEASFHEGISAALFQKAKEFNQFTISVEL